MSALLFAVDDGLALLGIFGLITLIAVALLVFIAAEIGGEHRDNLNHRGR